MKEISIVNYGLGNVYSIQNAILSFGYKVKIVNNAEEILNSSHLILPGVGAFNHAMSALSDSNLDQAIKEYSKEGRYILGICLGMQLLFDQSSENNITSGLKLLSGNVEKFSKKNSYKIPQIQWNKVTIQNKSELMSNLNREEFFYFLHSFYVNKDAIDACNIGTTNYAEQEYVSLIEKDNIFGTQFHPEKSGQTGLNLLQNFLRR